VAAYPHARSVAGLPGLRASPPGAAQKQIPITHSLTECVNREIAPLLVGRDLLLTERHWYDLFYRLNPRAQTGAWSSAEGANGPRVHE